MRKSIVYQRRSAILIEKNIEYRTRNFEIRSSLFIILSSIVVIMLCGCESKKTEQLDSQVKELLLYCAAGIRAPADELVSSFERQHGVKIVVDYAGSEVLLAKVKLARRGDLYMPGDRYYVAQAAAEGMILSQQPVCYWVATILVQKGNPKNIHSLHDLLAPGLKLGLGDAKACAIGRIALQIFAKNNIAWEQIAKNIAFQSLTVNELGLQIQVQSLDAVIVWDAIAKYYSQYGDQIPIPAECNVISTVDIGVLKFTKNRELAEKFVDFLTSQSGKEIFNKFDYRTEPPQETPADAGAGLPPRKQGDER